jgi:glycosyltransferase involved in cell wall biosynthesis
MKFTTHRSWPFIRARRRQRFLSCCAIVRNEARGILEWVAFHRLVGIEHFYIFDNGSTDDTAGLLQSRFAEDVVTLIPWPERPGQLTAYRHAIANFSGATEWCAFIDVDEFLFPTEGDGVAPFLESTREASALCAFWLIFGSNGHRHRPTGICIESFTRRAPDGFPINAHPKSIVRLSEARGVGDPHIFATTRGSVDEHGRPMARDPAVPALYQNCSHERIRINHYFTKSAEDWAIKQARGRADQSSLRPDRDFAIHDRNDVEDLTILRFLPRLRASLAKLA